MTFEDRLQSIDESLKALLVAFQTGASAVHVFGTTELTSEAAPAAAAKPGRKPKDQVGEALAAKANLLGLVEGDPDGTRYWVIEAHNTVYAQKPGDPDPQIASAKITTAADYSSKKAEYAKKSLVPPVAAEQPVAPAAESAPDATASTASSPAATPSFKEVTDKLMELSKDTRPGRGRACLVELLAKYLPSVEASARRVPALAELGKNAEIIAEVTALLVPDAVAAEADIFG